MNSVQDLLTAFNLKFKNSIECNTNEILFENSVKIYINKPQVINKWTAGSIVIENDENYNLINNQNDKILINKCLNNPAYEIDNREFLAKNLKIFQNINYFILYDRNLQIFIFKPYFLESNPTEAKKYCACWYSHAFEYDQANKCIKLYVESETEASYDENILWLSNILLKKISNWCLSIKVDDNLVNCIKLSTLTLYKNMIIDYYKLYQELKERYSNQFDSNWFELTNTNPEKFIHEDISIATHLILTWNYFNFGKSTIKFVDLGCGNGLLVYILNQEGYDGYGLDLRKRRIWDAYIDKDLKLKSKLIEKQIDPRVDIFDDCNWLIGNHSDELSPWLPVIANRSRSCNLYLIPCCFFDFNNKYDFNGIKKDESRYDNYINYLNNIYELNGYDVYKDKLRIPSTKNICLIGIRNPNKEINYEKLDLLISNQMNSFKIRDFEEEKQKSSRNCTRNVAKDLKEFIVKTIIDFILKTEIDGVKQEVLFIKKYDNSEWNAGREVNLSEIIKLFDKEVLLKLKEECGGIKTLIKNYHQLFVIVNKDDVKIRVDQMDNSTNKEKVKFLKTRNCLFEMFHPNGCLLESDKCSFKHINSQ